MKKQASQNEIVIYTAKDGKGQVEVRLDQDTLWLDAHQMARLFQRDRSVVVRHIHNIYGTEELDLLSTCAKNAQVAADGRVRQMDLYNLDMIIALATGSTPSGVPSFAFGPPKCLRITY